MAVRTDHAVLVEQRQLARHFQHALDHEHHVRAAGVVFVEDQRHRTLERPGQDAFAELGDLLAFLQDDGVLADQIDAADVAVEVDADAGPVEARRDLLDMGRLAGAVIALDHDAAVEGEAGEDRQRRLAVEAVGLVEVGHIGRGLREGRDRHLRIDAEHGLGVDGDVGRGLRAEALGHLGHGLKSCGVMLFGAFRRRPRRGSACRGGRA